MKNKLLFPILGGIIVAFLLGYCVGKKGVLLPNKITNLEKDDQSVVQNPKNTIQNQPEEVVQPTMPSELEVASKSPEPLVKEFYEWYIGNTDYSIYQNYHTNQPNENVIRVKELVKISPFISSGYIKNMEKRKGMYDGVLCTNDNEFTTVKQIGKAQVSGNAARVDIVRGYTKTDKTTKIQVMLKKEESWKIDDIICSFEEN